MEKGFTHVYTGGGKGKTTAALGLALRAAGAGLNSYIIQFMKEFPYSELNSLQRLNNLIEIDQCGGDDFVYKRVKPSKAEVAKVGKGLESARLKMVSGAYNLIILDEVLVSIYFELLKESEVLEFIKSKPENIELILTGRYASNKIIEAADLVTEMKEIKHYYQKGVLSRTGIEN
ncbi:MAG: cob(I)yrinic acid a,c-diamide adenosyltransferase [Melioribacteraceae bacterium]|nr:cob(I)yrinic acid a,c-diamide adenosyltransferase [Melioribacteraceae bacterium]MCF8263734.1 cob(I)yrinic acid a,c-diamide adenosyltransferase [Melioribacteraceae bacterium]MCF8432648.1 cob(I)yrinic acid a,c-diamide adenosyltransferase [Melioribacteraceae bacterium]